jgi:hypothetical protein
MMFALKYFCTYLIFTISLTVNLLLVSSAHAIVSDDSATRFHRTAIALQNDSGELRAKFVEIALMQMIEVYLAESDLARDEATRVDLDEKLRSWVLSVETYTEALILSVERVQAGAPVQLMVIDSGAVTVLIDDNLTILTHPRADQQRAYESNVLMLFCTGQRCAAFTQVARDTAPITETMPTLSPHWIFSGTTATCQGESGSISIEYQNQTNLAAMRSHCKQLFAEIRAVAAEMIRQSRHGVKLDWTVLEITSISQSTEYLLRFNSAGDSSVLSVPLMYASGKLIHDLRPWFVARVSRGPDPSLTLNGQVYGWQFGTR